MIISKSTTSILFIIVPFLLLSVATKATSVALASTTTSSTSSSSRSSSIRRQHTNNHQDITKHTPPHYHSFHQACIEALYKNKDDSNVIVNNNNNNANSKSMLMYSTKLDLEEFLNSADDNNDSYVKFEDLSPVVQYNFARATCKGNYPSTGVCSGVASVLDPAEDIAIPADDEEVVHNLCADLVQFMLLEQLGLLHNSMPSAISQSSQQRSRQKLKNALPAAAREMKSEIFSQSDDCPCIDRYDFGASCGQWALEYNDECQNNSSCDECIPSWCYNYWCFVDHENCKRPFISAPDVNLTSQVFTDVGADNAGIDLEGVFVSYETCGNTKGFEPFLVEKRAANYTLRYGIPNNSSDGYTLWTSEDGTEIGGSAYDFFDQVFVSDNSTFQIHTVFKEISEKSLTKYTSTYTACIHDVAIGELDICVGTFWTTEKRLVLSRFSNGIYSDEFYLVVRMQPDKVLWEYLILPFEPFTYDAWLYISVVTIYMAWAIRLIKVYTKNSMADDDRKNLFTWGSIGNAFYDAINSITAGGVTHLSEQPSIPEKVVISGFAMFALIVLTAYTATSAAVLIDKERGARYADLQDIINQGKNICLRDEISDTFLGLYPQFTDAEGEKADSGKSRRKIHKHHNDSSMFEELARDGENVDDCVGVIINVNSFEMLQATNSSYCEYSLVGDVVLSVISSIPVSPVNHTFYSDIAYIIQKSVGEGLYEQLVKGAQKKHVGPSKCNSEEKSHHEEEGVSVNAMELSSPIFFTFIMTTAGLFLCLYNVPTQQKKKLEHDIGTANDLALTEGIVRPSQPHMKSSVYTQDEWAEVSGKNSNRLRELVHKGATRTNKDLSRKGSENDFYDSVLEGVTGSTSIDKGELAGNSAARTTPQELATMGSERNGGDNPDEDDYYNYILRKYSDLSLRYSDRASKRRRPSAHRL